MNYLNYENRNYYLCFFEVFTIYPLGEISFILPGILVARYFLITRLKTQRVSGYHRQKYEGDTSVSLPWRYKFLKVLGTRRVLIILLISIWLVLQGVFLLYLIIFQFKCSKNLDQLLIYTNFSLVTLFSVIFFLFCIIDIVIISPLLLKCQFRKFIASDRFFFRNELLSILPIYLIFFLFNVVPHSDVFHFFFSSLIRWGLGIILVFSPLSFSIFFYFKNKYIKIDQSDYTKLDFIFDNEEYKKSFEKFCEEEFSIENFSFREDVKKFEKITNNKLRKETAELIFNKYLTEDSMLELNTNEDKKRKLQEKLDSNEITSLMFDAILGDSNINLIDTFSRWTSTPEFQLMKQNHLILTKVLKENGNVKNNTLFEPKK
jgi:hypothetical protein